MRKGIQQGIIAGVVVVALLVAIGFVNSILLGRENKQDQLVICARFPGADKSLDAKVLRAEIDALAQTGWSWNDEYDAVAAWYGCGAETKLSSGSDI